MIAENSVETFASVNPATGEEVARFPVMGPEQVAETVDRARLAAQWWADLGFDARRRRLMAFKGVIARRMNELADLLHAENGKPTDDALLEVAVTIAHLDWAARHAAPVLKPRHVRPGLLMLNYEATLQYEPMGVVGVIGPWNYPVHTPMGSISYALAAGNAVVFKPSELTPAVGAWLAAACAEVVPEQPVLQVVTGYGPTGSALCSSGVDIVAFTGSTRTGARVMAACAQTLTPVIVECGGKDALIVDDDADLDKAAAGAAWGGMVNAGQACVGTERVYVVDAVYDEFVARLKEKVEALRPGSDGDASYGPITMPAQVDVIRRHVEAALERGARPVVGGQPISGAFVAPVVLEDVPGDAEAVLEETFGPTLTLHRVRDIDEAVDRANATAYGLGGAVFGRKRAMAAARRMRTGMVSINSVQTFAAVPSLPFGGEGASGHGRIHGEDGLRSFSRAKGITRKRFGTPIDLFSFDRTSSAVATVVRLMRVLHGRG